MEKSSDSKRRRAEPTRPTDLLTGNKEATRRAKSPRSRLPRAKPTSPPLTLPDAIEIWKRRRLGETIHDIAAGFRVNPARIAEVLNGQRFPDAEKLSLI